MRVVVCFVPLFFSGQPFFGSKFKGENGKPPILRALKAFPTEPLPRLKSWIPQRPGPNISRAPFASRLLPVGSFPPEQKGEALGFGASEPPLGDRARECMDLTLERG